MIGSLSVLLNKVISVSHINRNRNKIEIKNAGGFILDFYLEQIKIALLPQAWNLLFIDKIRENKMVLCYEETVDY